MLDPANYKDVSSSLWPHFMFCELKITKILKSSDWGLEKTLPWEQNYQPSFNGLRCKLAKN